MIENILKAIFVIPKQGRVAQIYKRQSNDLKGVGCIINLRAICQPVAMMFK